ncbi:microcystin-dependent protein [Tenacibaculum adriaticum]|uniref:Microcystin-dependent protein n=1 Tax=Tenacibaculum adriaticum TaxID=413713 RepID=A0A5S5DT27_9FLAO|nr:tail fiber protein [Tenacibaculum adriaticum]TYP99083.1 microcystin-dependent protein [Tenacibaculum adriaticum]
MLDYIGEIRIFAFDFVPHNYIICDGRRLSKTEYFYLDNFLGDKFTYDNSDPTTFAIPDLRDRFPKQPGETINFGEQKGADEVIMDMEQMPEHTHETHIVVDNTTGGDELVNAPKNAFLNNNKSNNEKRNFSINPSENTFLGGLTQEDVGNSAPINIKNAHVKMVFAICIKGKEIIDPKSDIEGLGFMGEIKIWPSTIIPRGWVLCNGESNYTVSNKTGMGSIIGDLYGTINKGTPNEKLLYPNFKDRFATGAKKIEDVAIKGGKNSVLLSKSSLPSHTHNVQLAVNNNTNSAPHINLPNGTFINRNAGMFSAEANTPARLGGITEENKGGLKEIDIANSSIGLNYIICTTGFMNPPPDIFYTGEIILYASNKSSYLEESYLSLCHGQWCDIRVNPALFSLLGTKYGGDGRTYFNLPDLRDRLPLCVTNLTEVGKYGGANTIQLTKENLPAHNHNVQLAANVEADGTKTEIPNGILNETSGKFSTKESESAYLGGVKETSFTGEKVDIRNPYLTINHFISTNGIFPPRN